MSSNVFPFGTTRPVGGPHAKPAPDRAHPAEIVTLAGRRSDPGEVPEIPDQVWGDVDAAAQLWHDLRAQNREVRFDTHAVSGRVVASLCEVGGGSVVRRLPAREALGFDGPDSAA